MKRLAVLGASGHGKVVAEIAELLGWHVVFFDDAYPKITVLEHWTIIGTTIELLDSLNEFDGCFVAIGNNVIRLEKMSLLESYNANVINLIHPSAIVSDYAQVEKGTVVMAGAVINPFAKVGRACIINTAATIDHDCNLEDATHVSPGANLAGSVKIGRQTWVGIGASIKQGVNVGQDVIVGAGAAVINDVTDGLTVVGVPAKPVNIG